MMVLSAERAALKKELEATAKKVVSARASRGDLDGIRADLEGLEEPEPPTPRRYTTNDTSIEKMAELLMDNPDGLLLYRDELTGWLRSLDKAGHEAARAFYLEAWNGDGSHEVDRIGRGSLFVKAVCVSVLGGIQPGPLSSYVEGAFDDGESADGLLQRLQVLVYPDRGRFDPTDLSPDLDARDRAYKICKQLADLDVEEFVGGAPGEAEEVPYLNFDVLLKRIHRGDVEDGAKTRDIWRRGWSRLGTAGDLAEAIAVLEGLGWVRREEVKPNNAGRPSEILRLHPELRE